MTITGREARHPGSRISVELVLRKAERRCHRGGFVGRVPAPRARGDLLAKDVSERERSLRKGAVRCRMR